jgi:hypothetical protein
MRTPVMIADTLGLALCDVWPEEAGALPGLRDVPDPPYLVRPSTVGIGFDIPAPLPPAEEPRELRAKLAFLPERQQLVLSMRFGLDGPEMPLEALGAMLGCSRERVRQIEVQALQRLRELLGAPVPKSTDPRARVAPWRDGRADRHCARSSLECQAVELERVLEHLRTEGRPAHARTARCSTTRSSTACERGNAEPRVPPSLAGEPNGLQHVAMPAGGTQETIRSRIESFATELTDLVARSVLSEVQVVLGASPARPARGAVRGRKQGAGPGRPSTAPISLESYERMAIEHALAECSGATLAAARLLGVSKSAFYRNLHRLGIDSSSSAGLPQGGVRLDGPPSLAAYERVALERALAAAGGDKRGAAKLLRVGKSTMYRKRPSYASRQRLTA